MQVYKKTLLSLLFSSAGLILTGCNLPSPQQKDGQDPSQAAATFTAQAMADRSRALETQVQGAFAFPSSKVFNFQACVKDVAYDKAISGLDFLVKETNQKVTTDRSGCLTWSERVEYNFLGESQYIRVDRTIQGLGLHKGERSVGFAINPWSHGENLSPVLNPDDGNTIPRLVEDQEQGQKALRGFSQDNQARTRPLWIEEGRLFVTEERMTAAGAVLQVELRPNVAVQLTKMNGDLFLRPLTSGLFKLRMKLIHTYTHNNREVRRLLSETPLLEARMENGSFAVRSTMTLAAIPTRGQIMVGLELQALQGPAGLKNFEGVYLLGDYDQIKGASFLRLSTLVAQSQDFKLQQFINSTLEDVNIAAPESQADTYQRPRIEVAPLDLRFIRLGEERTSTREVLFTVTACLRNGLDGKSTRAHTFKVTKFKQSEEEPDKTVEIRTVNNACITWTESMTFKYFECQRFIKGFVQIANAELGMNEKLHVAINPWEANSGLLGRDLRFVESAEHLPMSCSEQNRPRTRLMADSFSYSTLSYSYKVDKLLNLTMTKKILFKTSPQILVYSNLEHGRAEARKLRDGVYLLRLVVVQNRDYDTSNTYVTSAERLVHVLNGDINTEISFETQDLKALGNRNQLLMEIQPVSEDKVLLRDGQYTLKNPSEALTSAIDSNTGLESPLFVGPITLNADESSRPLRLLDSTAIASLLLAAGSPTPSTSPPPLALSELIAKGQRLKSETQGRLQVQARKETIARERNLELLNLRTADETQPLAKAFLGASNISPQLMISKAELSHFVNSGVLNQSLARKLCSFWGHGYFRKLYDNKGGVIDRDTNLFALSCAREVLRNPSKFFLTEKQMLVKDVQNSEFQRGLNQGLNVGTSFTLSKARSRFVTESVSFGLRAGISAKFAEIFSVGGELGYSLSTGMTNSNAASNSISVNGSTSMTVQRNIFKINVSRHELCAVIRLNPTLFTKDTTSWFGRTDQLQFLNPRLSEAELSDAVTKGFMICEGVEKTEPQEITENYYLIAQETASSQMQDSGDSRNRNFFMALRSENDFQRFVTAIRGQVRTPQDPAPADRSQIEATQTLESLFKMPGPTYPGIFSN